jgi:hypothetical protein
MSERFAKELMALGLDLANVNANRPVMWEVVGTVCRACRLPDETVFAGEMLAVVGAEYERGGHL